MKTARKIFASCLFFVSLSLVAYARQEGAINWQERVQIPSSTGDLYFSHEWDPAAGLHLKLTHVAGTQEARISISAGAYEVRIPPVTGIPPALTTSPHINKRALPKQSGPVEITIKIRESEWALFVDNKRFLTLPSPFAAPAVLYQPSEDIPAEDDDAFFQKTEPFLFTDDFLVPEGEEGTLSAWTKVSGSWKLHTAIDNSVERRTIAKGAAKHPEPSRSPNFYSLSGQGSPGIITAGYDFQDDYSIEAALLTHAGEAGLVFYTPEGGDVHGFTISLSEGVPEALFRLWQSEEENCRKRQVFGAATANVPLGQWIKMKVVIQGNRVRCFMDHTLIFDEKVSLPAGGMYGLFTQGDDATRFDDVRVASFRDLDVRDVDGILTYAKRVTGAFTGEFKHKGWFKRKQKPSLTVSFPLEHPEGQMIIGAYTHDPHYFKYDITPLEKNCTVGLITGYTGPENPYFRSVYGLKDGRETFSLEKISPGKEPELMDVFSLPADKQACRLTLACDATDSGMIKFYRNGTLVLGTRVEDSLTGASGVWLPEDSRVAFASFEYDFSPPPVFRNKFEKNRTFATDPYMRHWSSPEGEWITFPDKTTWYKGDFHGRVALHMPYVENSSIYLSVPEGAQTGEITARVENGHLNIYDSAAEASPRRVCSVPGASMKPDPALSKSSRSNVNVYKVEVEGHLLTVSSGGDRLGHVYLQKLLSGRRIRLEGFSTRDLMHSRVDRYNVQDFLFTESLYNWTLNGGSWEVVNRFQCQPRWSHMNGESRNGLAALWNKYEFKGDFCLEMYAGMRHGWYERAGDLNMTIMNSRGTASEGYTITTTGWDPDHSQLWTKLYKNGEELARSSKYLVPRVREDNKRQGYNPLLRDGKRPIHGAWYYLKLRRVKDMMEFYFDNELVFTVRDPNPITMGSLGIWTYMNSMMVARVKCAAEEILPRSIPVTKVPRDHQLKRRNTSAEGYISLEDQNKLPYPLTRPRCWTVKDEVGQAALQWHKEKDGTPFMTLETRLGAGSFFAECEAPAMPCDKIAGWFMLVKRTRGAEFNFYYTLGKMNPAGKFIPREQVFHQISGAGLETDSYLKGGQTAVPSDLSPGPDWYRGGKWTPVIVWIDENNTISKRASDDWCVRINGFGNLQPSYVSQGLLGNAPGEAYAIKNVTPIRFEKPVFTSNSQSPVRFSIHNQQGEVVEETEDIARVNKALSGNSAAGLQRFYLSAKQANHALNFPVWWVHLPENPTIAIGWDTAEGQRVTATTPGAIPDYRFLRHARAAVNQIPVQLEQTAINRLEAVLPKTRQIRTDMPLEITLQVGDYQHTDTLEWDPENVTAAPVLTGLKGSVALALTFDERVRPEALSFDPKRMSLLDYADAPGSYLRVSNEGVSHRLRTQINQPLDLTRFPLLQFNYRGGKMAAVSLSAGPRNPIAFSEDNYPARTVRLARSPMIQDDQWHAWLGMLPDAIKGGTSLTNTFDIHSLLFLSFSKTDQTGLFSTLDLDNVVVGPAISRPEQFTLTPDYYAPQGIERVMFCTYSGSTPYMNLSEKDRNRLQWLHIPPGKTIQLSHLPPEGVNHMLLKGQTPNGLESDVFDIPFLVDTTPPRVSASLRKTANASTNGEILNLTIDCGQGAPLDPEKLVVQWGNEIKSIKGMSQFSYNGKTSTLAVNWPRVFREQIDKTKDGDVNRMTISQIQDGVGNACPDVSVAVVTDYAKDQQGPACLPLQLPDSVLWRGDWAGTMDGGLKISRRNELAVHSRLGARPHVNAVKKTARFQVTKDFARGKWKLTDYPLFSFTVRRPKYAGKQDSAAVELIVSLNRHELYVFPLTDNATGSLKMTLGQSFNWDRKDWTSGVIDLEDIMLETLTRRFIRDAKRNGTYTAGKDDAYRQNAKNTLARESVRMVGFQVAGSPKNDVFQIKDMCISKTWTDDDLITFDGYDASGLAGITVTANGIEKEFPGLKLRPAKTPESEWLSVRLRDRAGNHGPEYLFPGKR